jgi:hypothetical protein
MFKTLKSLFSPSRVLKPHEYTVFTVSEGREYVTHDGLGLKTQQSLPVSAPESENDSGDMAMADTPSIRISDINDEAEGEDESLFARRPGRINPATGLFMLNNLVDVGGNPYGISDDDDIHSDMSFDDNSMDMDNGIGLDNGFGFDHGTGIDDGFGFNNDL